MGGFPIVISVDNRFLLDELIVKLGCYSSPSPLISPEEIKLSFSQRREFSATLSKPRGRKEFLFISNLKGKNKR
ncbi:hypothetical protein CEE39_06580 [bacterium (candidate division B38) B3_B38]|nr:MAG: hypothetical protein CEE39_06580 [bacterium (candidate division B38) B3_B38]